MSNQPNSVYMDSIVQVQPATHNTWYEYGNSFSNIMITPPGETQILFEHDVAIEQAQRGKPLQRNTKRPSGADRSYYCNECGASFSNSSNLKSHARIHSGERPYVCNICGASFVQSSNMKAHKRVHTGERPYSCTECGQCFSRSSHLTGHKRTHTGERPYICGICSESFVTSTHMRNHMRKHTGERPFVCSVCKSSFAQNGSLQIHLRIHTGERPFKCGNCTSAFRSKGDLRSHHKLHNESRPYSCMQCDKTFKTKQYLHKHTKKCGAPPTGKKRGRPKKVTPIISSSDSVVPNENSQISVHTCPRGKRGRLKLRTHNLSKDYKLSNSDNEIDPDDIPLNPLKHEINESSEVQHLIELSGQEDNQSLYLSGGAKTSYVNHDSIEVSHLNSLNCNTELTQTSSSRDDASVSSVFH